MVHEQESKDTMLFVCDKCGFAYRTRKMAKKCEQWCSETNSCNLEITAHAVRIGG